MLCYINLFDDFLLVIQHVLKESRSTSSTSDCSSLIDQNSNGLECSWRFSILDESLTLFDSESNLLLLILTFCFIDFGLIVVNTFLSFIAFQKYLA